MDAERLLEWIQEWWKLPAGMALLKAIQLLRDWRADRRQAREDRRASEDRFQRHRSLDDKAADVEFSIESVNDNSRLCVKHLGAGKLPAAEVVVEMFVDTGDEEPFYRGETRKE